MHDCPKKMQYITSLLLPECRSEELHFPQPFGLVVVYCRIHTFSRQRGADFDHWYQ